MQHKAHRVRQTGGNSRPACSGDSRRKQQLPELTTSYSDVIQHLVEDHPVAQRTLAAWRGDPTKREVVSHVEAAQTAALYRLGTDDVLACAAATHHPLGEIKREVRDRVPVVRDWHPAFSFQHVLHHALETCGRLLTYQEFREFCRDDHKARRMLVDPARAVVARAVAGGSSVRDAGDALRWRIGLVYYSFLREAFVMAVLREEGMDARSHVLADCLFRVDFWVGETCFELFIQNAFFKRGDAGRKKGPTYYIGSSARLRYARLELPTQHRFGELHLPDRAAVVPAITEARGSGS